MSLKDLMKKGDDAAAAKIEKKPDSGPKRPVTSPGATALMAPTIDALKARATEAEGRAVELEAKLAELQASGEGEKMIAVGLIEPNPWQPRRVFDEAEIQKLAESIAEVGLIHPIAVRSVPSMDTSPATSKSVATRNTFQIVAGERRLRAHRLLAKAEIRAVVVEISDEQMALMAMAENIAREDLTPYEISRSIRAVQDQFKTTKHLAEKVGINRSDLYKFLAYADLPAFVIGDLDVTPGILGRDAAYGIVTHLKKGGQAAINALEKIWPRVKSGDLEQGKIVATIEASLAANSRPVRTERDIKKLFVGNEQAGSITRDAGALTIKLRTAALNAEQEERLRTFVEDLLRG